MSLLLLIALQVAWVYVSNSSAQIRNTASTIASTNTELDILICNQQSLNQRIAARHVRRTLSLPFSSGEGDPLNLDAEIQELNAQLQDTKREIGKTKRALSRLGSLMDAQIRILNTVLSLCCISAWMKMLRGV